MPGAEQQTNITIGANTKPFVDGLKQAKDAAASFEQAIDKLIDTSTSSQQSIALTARQIQSLVDRYDPAARSARQYAQAEADIAKLLVSGNVNREQANRMLDQASQKYNTLAAQAQRVAQAEPDAVATAAKQQEAAYNQVKPLLDPQFQQHQSRPTIQKTLPDALPANRHEGAEETKLLPEPARQFGNVGGAAKLSSMQMMLAFDQLRQAGDQIIAGGGFFRPLIMQLPVAAQMLSRTGSMTEGLSNAFGLLRQNIGTVLGVGGIVAVTGALALMALAAENSQRAINNIGSTLQKTGNQAMAPQVRQVAKTLAETTSYTTKDAQDVVTVFAGARGVNKSKDSLLDLAKTAQDMAAVLHESVTQAAQDIVNGLADPTAAATKYMEEGVKGFDAKFKEMIQDLQNSGHTVEAANLVFAKVKEAFKGAADNVTPLQKALRDLSEAFTATGDTASRKGPGIGVVLTNGLAGAVEGVAKLVLGMNDLIDAFQKMGATSEQITVALGAGMLSLISPIRNVEIALGRIIAIQIPAWFGALLGVGTRSEERRVGKECRSRWS